MESSDTTEARLRNDEVRRIWNQNAGFWDRRFGEGNDFHKTLVEPATDRLLGLQAGEQIFEIACGNGAYARHLAEQGAFVIASDFSEAFLELARERTTAHAGRIEYRLIDATDAAQLLALGEHRFDAAVANMALMDMAAIEPLLTALPRLLKPGGRFVFSVMHPCFNNSGIRLSIEEEDRDGLLQVVHAIKVVQYLGLQPAKGLGMIGQPEPHYYFHRPLSVLFGACFQAGLVLDGLEEPAFPQAAAAAGRPFNWDQYPEIPPVIVARLRTPRNGEE